MENPFKIIKKLFVPDHPLISEVATIITELEMYFSSSKHSLDRFGQEFDEIVEYLATEREIHETRKDLQTVRKAYKASKKDLDARRIWMRAVVRAEFYLELLNTQRSDAKVYKVEKRISLLTKYVKKLRAYASEEERSFVQHAQQRMAEMQRRKGMPPNAEFKTSPSSEERVEEKVFHSADDSGLGEEPNPSPA